MLVLAFFLVGLSADPTPQKKLSFGACPGYLDAQKNPLHFVCAASGEHAYLIHFHMRVEELAGKTVFVRLTCKHKPDGGRETIHTTLKEVKIEKNDETWAVYMDTVRYPKAQRDNVVYNLALGIHDPTEVNDYVVLNPFAWKIPNRQEEVMSEIDPEPIGMRELVKTSSGGWYVKTVYTQVKYMRDIRSAVRPITDLKSGPETFRLIK